MINTLRQHFQQPIPNGAETLENDILIDVLSWSEIWKIHMVLFTENWFI